MEISSKVVRLAEKNANRYLKTLNLDLHKTFALEDRQKKGTEGVWLGQQSDLHMQSFVGH